MQVFVSDLILVKNVILCSWASFLNFFDREEKSGCQKLWQEERFPYRHQDSVDVGVLVRDRSSKIRSVGWIWWKNNIVVIFVINA